MMLLLFFSLLKIFFSAPAIDHQAWDVLLQKHVNEIGQVDYAGFKREEARLDAYLKTLSTNPPSADWSREAQMAFWINTYNAYTIKLIVKNYPVKSITELEGGKPWDKKWISIGKRTYSLDQIENDILRPKFKDPRIHFALNCAARSCPPLLNRAWTADKLEEQFERQAKSFINNPKFNRIGQRNVQISRIFDWYAEDFGPIVPYLNRYANQEVGRNAKVSYQEYDWSLNGK